MNDDIRLLHQFAIYTGILLKKLRFPASILKRMEYSSFFFRFLCLLLTYGDELCWLGSNRFRISEFNVDFKLNTSTYFWLTSYLKTKDSIKFNNNHGKLYATVKNMKFHVPNIASALVLKETFLDEEYDFFDVENSVVVDIGAYIGDTAVFFAHRGAKKIVAYEPNPTRVEMAKENFALNGYSDKIVLVNAAVGAENGILQLSKELRVNQLSIRSVLDNEGSIDLLKMDIEGAEWEIMEKCVSEGLLENVEKIVMEVHGVHPERMKKILRNAKYKIKQSVSYGKTGMMIAASKV